MINKVESLSLDFQNNTQKLTKPSKDQLEMSVALSNTTIDYNPSLKRDLYDKIFLQDFTSVSLTQSDL